MSAIHVATGDNSHGRARETETTADTGIRASSAPNPLAPGFSGSHQHTQRTSYCTCALRAAQETPAGSGEDIKFIARRDWSFSPRRHRATPTRMALVLRKRRAQAVIVRRAAGSAIDALPGRHLPRRRPKSNAATIAIGRGLRRTAHQWRKAGSQHLRDSHYPGGKAMGMAKAISYPHDFPATTWRAAVSPRWRRGNPFYEPTEQEPKPASKSVGRPEGRA